MREKALNRKMIRSCFMNLVICFIKYVIANSANESTSERNTCKYTHMGLDFIGVISKTEFGYRCQKWAAENPVHLVDKSFLDEDFPEGSKFKAKNYCRNPSRAPFGPWCYTLENSIVNETCGIPLCKSQDCKLTGPGMEYSGKISKSATSEKCKKWSKNWSRRNILLVNGSVILGDDFNNFQFSDQAISAAGSFCRNPDGDLGGPWCYIESESDDNIYIKQYCDINFCDDRDCEVYTYNYNKSYSHFINFNPDRSNITFSVRLWNPDDTPKGQVKILLSTLDIPASDHDIISWGSGIELSISNNATCITVGNEDLLCEETPFILKSTDYTNFTLTWDNRMFILVWGEGVMWEFPFCDDDFMCEIHTTYYPHFQYFWPLRKKHLNLDLSFSVRTFNMAMVELLLTPTDDYPRIMIVLGVSNKYSRITYESCEKKSILLQEVAYDNIVSYWEWSELEINLHSKELEVLLKVESQFISVMKVEHWIMNSLRWFSISSNYSLTHWSLYCVSTAIGMAYPPECATTPTDYGYEGTQYVTSLGHPCIPWLDKTYIPKHTLVEAMFKGSRVSNINYCRNIMKKSIGPWCFALTPDGVVKESCHVRICEAMDCKVAGTANDYTGQLNITRSHRTCLEWSLAPASDKSVTNDTLYPDGSQVKANNYCRNPSRSLAGAWCYTTDKQVLKDLCEVKDCKKEEQNIVLTRRGGAFRHIYVLPEWKFTDYLDFGEPSIQLAIYCSDNIIWVCSFSLIGESGGLYFSLKEWNPDLLDGILFKLFSKNKKKSYTLEIGAEHNEKVILHFQDSESSHEKLLLEKTLLHLIPAGRWGSFSLKMGKGQVILGLQKRENPIFEWVSPDKYYTFEPAYMTYQSLEGNVIGVHFQDKQCHTENTSTSAHTRIYPVNMWRDENFTSYANFTVYLRGTGVVLIPLLIFPGDNKDYLAITIGDKGNLIFIIRNREPKAETLAVNKVDENVINEFNWTKFNIVHNERVLLIYRNNILVNGWKPNFPLLFYWFAMSCENGWLLWTVNCEPPNIDEEPIDGGWSEWSEWQCSVTCGEGIGMRKRVCDNPKPNIFGHMCEGAPLDTGKCNDFECGDLSPDTLALIKQKLRHEYFSVQTDEGENVIFEQPLEIIDHIKKEAPDVEIKWTLNGRLIIFDEKKISADNSTITIMNVTKKQNGVYMCLVYEEMDRKTPIKIVTVAVKSKKVDKIIREGSSLSLPCKSLYLDYIYMDLNVKWLLNDSGFADYGIVTVNSRDNLFVKQILLNHSGTWSCVTEQSGLGFIWITNVFKILVIPKKSLFTHLREDKMTRFIFGSFKSDVEVASYVIGFFICFVLCACCCVTIYIKAKKSVNVRFGRNSMKSKKKRSNKHSNDNVIMFSTISEEDENLSLIESEYK